MTSNTIRTLARITDTKLAENWNAQGAQFSLIQGCNEVLFPPRDERRARYWRKPTDSVRERYVAKVEAAHAELCRLADEAAPLEELHREHRWSRFYLVTNTNGHVHSSMRCSSCFSTTSYAWLPDLSGADEDEAIEEWGERMCTVCFPNAPVHPRFSQPCKRDQAARDAVAADKAAKAAAKRAASVELADGTTFKSVRAATNNLGESLSSLAAYGMDHPSADRWVANALSITEALHAKGESFDLVEKVHRAVKRQQAATRKLLRDRPDFAANLRDEVDMEPVWKALGCR